MSDWVFPQYRKFIELDVWYRIDSIDEFVEIKRIGDQLLMEQFDAEKYPEKLRVQDMLECLEGRWEPIEATDFERIESQAE